GGFGHAASLPRPSRRVYVAFPRALWSSRGSALRGLPAVGGGPARLLALPLRGAAPADAGLEEAVQVAVEDRRRVADLVLRAQVLDHLVGVQDVGAHLVAPAGLDVAGHRLLLGRLLLLAEQQQP